jgi:hypothetical protein
LTVTVLPGTAVWLRMSRAVVASPARSASSAEMAWGVEQANEAMCVVRAASLVAVGNGQDSGRCVQHGAKHGGGKGEVE